MTDEGGRREQEEKGEEEEGKGRVALSEGMRGGLRGGEEEKEE